MLNKPIHVGFTVPELSKYLMYDFHYTFTKKKFDTDLLFTNTNILTYEIKLKDVYEENININTCLSNYPRDTKFFNPANEMVIGKVKDEFKRIPINEFLGLKSKIYCIIFENGEEVNTAKVVNI